MKTYLELRQNGPLTSAEYDKLEQGLLHALMTLARSDNPAIDKSYVEEMLNSLLSASDNEADEVRNDILSNRALIERRFDNDSGRLKGVKS